jgi:Zn-dependent protease with chaperone function
VPWSIDAARVINSPAVWTLLRVLWNAALVAVAFVAAAELEAWAFASAVSEIPERLGRALRSIEEQVRPLLYTALFIDRPLGAATLCEVRWRPFRRPILIVSRATLDGLDDGALEGALAHEAAHIKWGHLTGRLLWAYGLWLATTVTFGFFNPRSLFGYQAVSVSAGLTYLFLLLSVVRLQEEQADRYAAEVVGAEALLGALGRLSQSPLELFRGPDLSIWTTHGSWKARRERLLAMRRG